MEDKLLFQENKTKNGLAFISRKIKPKMDYLLSQEK